jgi:hypothetical protein
VQRSISSNRRGGFSGELWRSIESIYAEILDHPFLRGLTDGTLSEESFLFYVLQSTFSICKKSALSGKAPLISDPPSGRIVTESLSIL